MTPRDRFLAALRREPLVGRVPHFELIFYPTMEEFGRLHPDHRNYRDWLQMSATERDLHRREMANLYLSIAERFEHSAIFLRPNPRSVEETCRLIDLIRQASGDRYCLLRGGDATWGIPDGQEMERFCDRLVNNPDGLKAEASERLETALRRAEELQAHGGLDGFCLNTDYCFQRGPFLSPAQFAEFVTPFLHRLTRAYRDLGFYVIKHTDGNVMPILDQLVQTGPHAIHSLDPQAGVDLATVKRLYGDRVALIGNVNCGLLETGTEEAIRGSVAQTLRAGMPGGGYVFSTSNCIYTGMPVKRYELMLEVWREQGNYPETVRRPDCAGEVPQ